MLIGAAGGGPRRKISKTTPCKVETGDRDCCRFDQLLPHRDCHAPRRRGLCGSRLFFQVQDGTGAARILGILPEVLVRGGSGGLRRHSCPSLDIDRRGGKLECGGVTAQASISGTRKAV